jgi:hypothetical protein
MPRRTKRFRRCPSCGVIRQATEFRRATGTGDAVGQLQRRTCPVCGHIAPLLAFTIVEQPKPDQGEAN